MIRLLMFHRISTPRIVSRSLEIRVNLSCKFCNGAKGLDPHSTCTVGRYTVSSLKLKSHTNRKGCTSSVRRPVCKMEIAGRMGKRVQSRVTSPVALQNRNGEHQGPGLLYMEFYGEKRNKHRLLFFWCMVQFFFFPVTSRIPQGETFGTITSE